MPERPVEPTPPVAPSKAESNKASSRALRGTIAESLASPATHFEEVDSQLLKFHGIYQGYDRDTLARRRAEGRDKDFHLMVRARIPGGRLDAAQYLALDALADRYANGSLRLTTRQAVQFHGVLKSDLKEHVAAMNRALVTTLGACGDVVRNVVTCPAPIRDAAHDQLEADARRLSEALSPRTRAYHELWLDGEKLGADDAPDPEPLYGRTYLPRKFKIGLALLEDNSIDVLTNDLGIVAIFEGSELRGYNLCLGGGLGMTHNKPETFPRLATPVAFVTPDLLLAAAEAAVMLERDHGDRTNRKHARLKYVIEERGADWARATLGSYLGRPLDPARPMPRFGVVDHHGWHEQGDGLLYLGIPVSSGRIADTPEARLRTALREVVERWRPRVIVTPGQDLILGDLAPHDRPAIEAVLRGHGVRLREEIPAVQRLAMACPALPTCSLALAEAERIKAGLLDAIAAELARHGLAEEAVTVRLTGCPNGCARPYTAEVGIVGRAPGQYALFVAGAHDGTRLARKLFDKLAQEKLPAALGALFGLFAANRRDGERFGDFCDRWESADLLAAAEGALRAEAI